MARRIAGQRSQDTLSGLQLVGPASPIVPAELPSVGRVGADYLRLLSTWGAGWAYGCLEVADPRGDVFRGWQERFRFHATPMQALGVWKLDADAREQGSLVAVCRGTGVLATPDAMVLVSPSHAWTVGSGAFADVLEWVRTSTRRPRFHYITRSSLIAGLLATEDAAGARRILEQICDDESVEGLLRAASAVATSSTPTLEVRVSVVRAAIEMALQRDPDCVRLDPDTVERTLRRGDDIPELHDAAHPFDIFAGIGDLAEEALVAALQVNPDDAAKRSALVELYENRGFEEHAQLIRTQSSAAAPLADVEKYGVMYEDAATCAARVENWAEAWRATDATLPIEALQAEIAEVEPPLRRAIVNWIIHSNNGRLDAEHRSNPFLVLADQGVGLLAHRRVELAQPFLLARLREGLSGDEAERRAIAYARIGKLPATNLSEVLGWLANESRRSVAMCLLQGHGRDERVFAAALAHFVDTHPYSERVIGKRCSEPRVAATLIPLFESADRSSVTTSGRVLYSEELVVLAKFLAKLGHRRAIDVCEQYTLRLRVDREESAREAARERRADFGF